MSSEIVLNIDALSKTFNYGKIRAVSDVHLSVRKGELFGIIGPDGAGKTTLFRILATLLQPDSGSVSVDGMDLFSDYKSIRKHIGYMPGKFSLYPDLTVMENLQFFASIFGTTVKKNHYLIKDIFYRLEPFVNRKAGELSGGMKQKLALCCSLIHAPSILFLDEPTTGVDPSSRYEFWEILRKLKDAEISILVSTAYMDEASRCDRISMMNLGGFIATGVPKNIIESFDKTLLAISSDDMFRLLGDLRQINDIEECYTFGSNHHVRLSDKQIEISYLRKILEEQYNHRNVVITCCKPTIEDCFMKESKKEYSYETYN